MLGPPPLTRRTLSIAAAAAATSAAAGVALQRRHLRALSRDPEYTRLRRPLGGGPLPIVSADGTALHGETFGPSDAPTIVLAHGWTEQLGFWGPVIDVLLRRGYRVVAYDLRGHGRSAPAVDGDYRLERFGEDLAAVLDAAVPGGRPGDRRRAFARGDVDRRLGGGARRAGAGERRGADQHRPR